jgi:4-amino-4-deoxy-L-arabinose transferase-like glycosyltransferase
MPMTRSLLALCVICSILFFLNLQSRDFWAPDEGDFAQIARELPENHVVPHLNGKPYGEKPPLYYYIIYLSKKLLGWAKDEVSLRFPSGLFALLGAIFLFVTIRRFLDHEKAILSTCILISTPLYYWQARYLQVDMVFSVFVSSCLLLFFWFYNTRKVYLIYLSFLFLAFAFLVKGPLAIVLVLPVVIIFLFLEKAIRTIRARDLLIGVLIFIAIVLPWYLAVYIKEGTPYLYENVIRQNFIRFFDAWSHRRPFYYYFTTLPLDFFPWSLFLPLGLFFSFKRFKSDGGTKYFLVWFAWMFFFLSLSSGKISKYMLPVLPAITLITSLAFVEEKSKYNKIMLVFLAFFFFVISFSLFFLKKDFYQEFYPERVVVGSLCIVLGIGLLLLQAKRIAYAFTAIFSFIIIAYTIGNTLIYQKWNKYKSPKYVAEMIAPYVKDCTPWVYYGSMRGVYIYYVGKKAFHIDEHDIKGLHEAGQKLSSFFILTKKRDVKEVYKALNSVDIVFEEKNSNSPMVFLRYTK